MLSEMKQIQKQRLHGVTYMWNLRRQVLPKQRAEWRWPGTGLGVGRRNGEMLAKGYLPPCSKMSKFCASQ